MTYKSIGLFTDRFLTKNSKFNMIYTYQVTQSALEALRTYKKHMERYGYASLRSADVLPLVGHGLCYISITTMNH
jgi:hypothetical protein